MNKKTVKLIILVLFIVIVILSSITVINNKISKDEIKFRIEYEKFNNKTNLSKEKYVEIHIPERNGIRYTNSKEIIRILKKGTGIIYFGFPQSNWSRDMIEVLIDATIEKDVSKIYYLNAYGLRDEKYIDEDNNLLTLKKGTDEYYKILELLGDKAEIYEGLNDDSIKRLYFPTVIFVKNGKIVSIHTSTVESHKDKSKKLNSNQKKELKNIYINGINKIISKCEGSEKC